MCLVYSPAKMKNTFTPEDYLYVKECLARFRKNVGLVYVSVLDNSQRKKAGS